MAAFLKVQVLSAKFRSLKSYHLVQFEYNILPCCRENHFC